MKRAAVVLFSGGLDSTLALIRAKDMPRLDRVASLMIDYGQPHRNAEFWAAGQILHRLGMSASQICIADSLAVARPSERMANSTHVTHAAHPAEIPGRNAQFLTNALTHGRAWWPDHRLEIWIGATLDDAATFVDCTPEFIDSASHFLTRSSRVPVDVIAPFGFASQSADAS